MSTLEFDFISPGVEKVLGYKPDEVSLNFLLNLIHPDDIIHFSKNHIDTGTTEANIVMANALIAQSYAMLNNSEKAMKHLAEFVESVPKYDYFARREKKGMDLIILCLEELNDRDANLNYGYILKKIQQFFKIQQKEPEGNIQYLKLLLLLICLKDGGQSISNK